MALPLAEAAPAAIEKAHTGAPRREGEPPLNQANHRQEAARLGWVDLSRGMVVFTVVLLHVGLYFYLPVAQPAPGNAVKFWTEFSSVLETARMPALLVISGWLASTQVRQGLGSARTRRRIWTNGWLYVVWLVAYAGITMLLGGTGLPQSLTFADLGRQLPRPDTTLWFLAGLVWYVAVFSALRRVPAPLILTGVAVLSGAAMTLLSTSMGLWVRIPQYAVFFALGVWGRQLWAWLAARPWIALGGGAALISLAVALSHTLEQGRLPEYPATLLTSIGAVSMLFGAASIIARTNSVFARAGQLLGRHTVSVYVMHYPVLMALMVAKSGSPLFLLPRQFLFGSQAALWTFPVLATLLIVVASLLCEQLLRLLGLNALFQLPNTPTKALRAVTAPLKSILRPAGMPANAR